MRVTSGPNELERLEFARKAAAHFAENKAHWSFGDIEVGAFLALRWGTRDDCVLVLRQADDFEATVYQSLIAEFTDPSTVQPDRIEVLEAALSKIADVSRGEGALGNVVARIADYALHPETAVPPP